MNFNETNVFTWSNEDSGLYNSGYDNYSILEGMVEPHDSPPLRLRLRPPRRDLRQALRPLRYVLRPPNIFDLMVITYNDKKNLIKLLN
jgi:hypothetical protein